MLIGRMHVSDKHSGSFRGVCVMWVVYLYVYWLRQWLARGGCGCVFRLLGTRSGGCVGCGLVRDRDKTRSVAGRLLRVG